MSLRQRRSLALFFLVFVALGHFQPALAAPGNPKNPFHILGVTRNSSQKDIQKRYKTLCLKYHPDKNVHLSTPKERQRCEEMFKEVQNAYSQIGDEQARRSYDFQERYGLGGSSASPFSGRSSSTPAFDPDSFFRSFPMSGPSVYFSRGADGRPRFGVRRSYPSNTHPTGFGVPGASNSSFKSIYKQKVQVPLEQLYTGSQVEFHLVDNVWTRWRAAFRGKIIYLSIYQGLMYSLPVVRTSRVVAAIVGLFIAHITLPKPDPEQTYVSKLPRGIKGNNGSKVRFQPSRYDEPEVIFEILEATHPRYSRIDNDLHTTVQITRQEAERGCTKRIAALDPSQDAIVVEIPPQAASGSRIRIRGEGWPTRNADIHGDLLVKVEIKKGKGKKREKRKSK